MKHLKSASKPRPASTVIFDWVESKVATVEQLIDEKAGSVG